MFSQMSCIPDLIWKFRAKRCGLYALLEISPPERDVIVNNNKHRTMCQDFVVGQTALNTCVIVIIMNLHCSCL